MQKGFAWLVILIVGLLLIGGGVAGYIILTKPKFPIYASPLPVITSDQTSPEPQASSVDKIADRKTYTNTKRGYEFKYPNEYKLTETAGSKTEFESVSLKKDQELIKGGGQAGGDVLRKGVVISFIIILDKKLVDLDLGSTKDILMHKKKGVEKVFSSPTSSDEYRDVYIEMSDFVLRISFNAGFDSSSELKGSYEEDFNNILKTFKFL